MSCACRQLATSNNKSAGLRCRPEGDDEDEGNPPDTDADEIPEQAATDHDETYHYDIEMVDAYNKATSQRYIISHVARNLNEMATCRSPSSSKWQ